MRNILSSIDRAFVRLDLRSRELLDNITDDELFAAPTPARRSMMTFSCGEYIVRSAAVVEKAFGGITTRLWDDPYEWTLPERLANKQGVSRYLNEVEATRHKGLEFISSDADLIREIPAPGRLKPLIEILLEALTMAAHYQGRSFAVFTLLSDKKLPRL